MASLEIPRRYIIHDQLDMAGHHRYVPSLDRAEIEKRKALSDKGYTKAAEQAAGTATVEKVLHQLNRSNQDDDDIEPIRQWTMIAGASMLNAGLYGMRLIGDARGSYYADLARSWFTTTAGNEFLRPEALRHDILNDLVGARIGTDTLRRSIELGAEVSARKIEILSRHLLHTGLTLSAFTVDYDRRDSTATRQMRIRDLADEMMATKIELTKKVVGVEGPMNVSLSGLSSTRSELGQHILNDRSYRPEVKLAFQQNSIN